MSSLSVDSVAPQSFGIQLALRDDTLSVKLTGTGDMAAAAPLSTYIRALQGEVTRQAIGTVEFDVRGLCFLSSSCLKALIAFISNLVAHGLRCKVRFLTDAKAAWQRRSLIPLDRMCPELVSIADT